MMAYNNNHYNNNNGSTPIDNSSDNDFASTVSQFAQSTFTKQNIEAATNYTKEQAIELQKQAQDGNHSLRFLGVVAGLACVVVGIIELISRSLRFDIVGALIDCYIIIVGVMIIVLESKRTLLPAELVDNVHKYALFLTFLWGRGSLYFVIGTLLLYQLNLLNLIAGGYMCAVGVLYLLVRKRTVAKLQQQQRKYIYSEESLRTKYNEVDIDGSGLDISRFKAVCFNLGLDLTRLELEATFEQIQSKSKSERLRYQDFQAWWNEDATHF
jgi:hypothetical protein